MAGIVLSINLLLMWSMWHDQIDWGDIGDVSDAVPAVDVNIDSLNDVRMITSSYKNFSYLQSLSSAL